VLLLQEGESVLTAMSIGEPQVNAIVVATVKSVENCILQVEDWFWGEEGALNLRSGRERSGFARMVDS